MDFRRETLSDLISRRTLPELELDGHPDPPVVFPVPVKPYEVLLSFDESDTLKTFTDHLYHDFIEAGVRTFRHSQELQSTDEDIIGTKHLVAINQSKISIAVFSKNYASSIRCLTELGHLVDCSEKKEHKIIPVFLDLTPSEVRSQMGHYHKAFEDHEKKYEAADVLKWRETLRTVGSLKGLDMENANRYQGKLAKEVVSKVFKELKRQHLDVPESLVGIDVHVDAILNLLDIQNKGEEVRIVGIWGMGGIGKTTIAKLVYNQLIPAFDYCSFLDDVREKSKPKGLESLQSQLVSDLTRHNHEDIPNIDSGKYMFKDRFLNKKVLILLDDVDHAELFEDLIPNVHQSVAPGSRIIITTRDRSVLDECQVGLIYRVTEMGPDDAFQLFCKHAFRQDYPVTEFANLAREVAKATGGLPLAIKAIGSYLSYNLREDIWVEELGGLRIEPQIQERLMVSFDALDQGTREIFLDIACLFNGMDSRILVHMWKACGFSPVSSINDLMRKSLIIVGDDHKLWMHVQLRSLGRDILYAENHMPGSRSRLWRSDDGLEVLENVEGTERVKAICLASEEELQEGTLVNGDMFRKMSNLEFLELGSANLDGQFKGRLLRLKWLSWHGDTELLNIPSDLHLKNLVILDLSDSSIVESWKGWSLIKAAKKLEVLNLSRCHQLRTTPDFTPFPSLKRLILEECRALVAVDPSVGHLKFLESLNLKNCLELEKLPQELGSLEALTELIIDRTSIQEIPISSGMRNLEILSCKLCKSLTQLPDSIQFLVQLRWLFLDHCESLTKIPTSVLQLVSLEELNLSHTLVELLPDSLGRLSNLKVLDISYSKIRNLPCSVGNLEKLEVINASKCLLSEGEIPLGVLITSSLRLDDCTRISTMSDGIERLSSLRPLQTEVVTV